MDWNGLFDKYPDDHKQINDLRVRANKLETLRDFNETETAKIIKEYCGILITGINNTLMSETPMENSERQLLLERRRNYLMFKGLFENAEKQLESIDQQVSYKLKD